MAIVKCMFCKKEIDKDSSYLVKSLGGKNMYYCNKDHYKKQQDKIKYKPNVTNANGEINQRRLLTDWVQDYYISQGWDKTEINWKLETAVLKNIMDTNKFKYSGILLTLEYMCGIIGLNLINNESHSVFALVPFYYDECKKYYIQTKDLEKKFSEYNFDDEKVIKVKGYNKDFKQTYKLIDIDDL